MHAPFGGRGLNLGVQDSVNLGWKLARVMHGTSPESLLDTHDAERHPVAARVLRNTMAQRALQMEGDRVLALRDEVAALLALDAARTHVAAMISGLDICYASGEAHPMVGRRMPDLDLDTPSGATRVYEQLHGADWLVIAFEPSARFDVGPTVQGLRLIEATSAGPWQLPVIGRVEPPAAVLIRPDGYVAWAGDGERDGVRHALRSHLGHVLGV